MSWPTAGGRRRTAHEGHRMIVIILVFAVSLVMIAIAFVNNRRL